MAVVPVKCMFVQCLMVETKELFIKLGIVKRVKAKNDEEMVQTKDT